MEKESLAERIKALVVNVPDYPKKGISFKDLTPLFASYEVFDSSIKYLSQTITSSLGEKPDFIVGVEARGFIVGTALAKEMGLGFVPIRKAGKLPRNVVSEEYALEYSTAKIELQKSAMPKRSRVIIADDLLATGGTSIAASNLIAKQGSITLGFAFIVSLSYLEGKKKLSLPVFDIVEY
jgi:adenine phosphoribosyltransferase